MKTDETHRAAARRGRRTVHGLTVAAIAIVAATSSGCACTARAGAGGTTLLHDRAAPTAAVTIGVGPGTRPGGTPFTASFDYLGGSAGAGALTFGAEVLRHSRPHGFRLGLRAGPLWMIGNSDARPVVVAEVAWILAPLRRTDDSEGIALDLFTAFVPDQRGPGPWFGLRLSYELDEYWMFHGIW